MYINIYIYIQTHILHWLYRSPLYIDDMQIVPLAIASAFQKGHPRVTCVAEMLRVEPPTTTWHWCCAGRHWWNHENW